MPVELLHVVRERYQFSRPEAKTWHWRKDAGFQILPRGSELIVFTTRFLLPDIKTMPRSDLEISAKLERLSILADDGSVDEDLLPKLDADFQRRIHRTMLLSRRFDERLLTLQKQGRIGSFAPAISQEGPVRNPLLDDARLSQNDLCRYQCPEGE